MFGTPQFESLLQESSRQLFAANQDLMSSAELLPTPNTVDAGDVELFFRGVEAGLIRLEPSGRFNTFDRPKEGGRWALLSRSRAGGWFNAEYLPQLAAYVEAILDLGYPCERVLFELPAAALQLDLAILDDAGHVMVLGEAKRSTPALATLARGAVDRFGDTAPTDDTKRRGDEQRQLAWRLWTVAPQLTCLIGPGHREAFRTTTNPLRLQTLPHLPHAADLGLDNRPAQPLHPTDPVLNNFQ
jgi:hypothetical protein